MPFSPLERAEAHLRAGELEDALAALSDVVEAFPTDDGVRRMRAAVLARLDGDDNKFAALDDLKAIASPSVVDYLLQSTLHQQLADPDAAVESLLNARRLAPDDEQIIQRQAYLFMSLRRFRDARALIDSMPRTWLWWMMSGDLASEYEGEDRAIQDYSAALDDLERMLRGDETHKAFYSSFAAGILAGRGTMYATLGRFPEAEGDFAAAYAMNRDPSLLFNRGLIAFDLGNIADAVAYCGQALAESSGEMQRQLENILHVNRRYAPLVALLLAGDQDV